MSVQKLISTRNVEAERAIIGTILLAPGRYPIASRLPVAAFTDKLSGVAFNVIDQLWKEKRIPDVISVKARMQAGLVEFDSDVIPPFLLSCMDGVPIISELSQYVSLVDQAYRLRNLGAIVSKLTPSPLPQIQKTLREAVDLALPTPNVAVVEDQILASLLASGSMVDVIEAGVTPQVFTSPLRGTADFIWDYFRQYSSVPNIRYVEEQSVPLPVSDPQVDVLKASCRTLLNQAAYYRLRSTLLDAVAHVSVQDLPEWQIKIVRAGMDIAALTTQSRDVNTATNEAERNAHYQTLQDSQGVQGLFCRWGGLTRLMHGFCRQRVHVFVGRPNMGKTTVACVLAADFLLDGQKVLFFTKEMTAQELQDRVECILGQVSWPEYNAGTFSKAVTDGLAKARKLLKSGGPLVIVEGDAEQEKTGLSFIQAKVEQYQPDVLIVDGAYLVEDETGRPNDPEWKAATRVVRGFKRLARKKDIPVILTTQFNRTVHGKRGVSLNALAGTDAFAQDSDYVVALVGNRELKSKRQLCLQVLKARFSDYGSWLISFNMETSNFGEIREKFDHEKVEYDAEDETQNPVNSVLY